MNTVPFDLELRAKAKMHSLDRIIVLRPMDGKKSLSSAGTVDNRLFNGENRLHAVWDVNSGAWEVRYDKGIIPAALDMKFTELTQLIDMVRNYYARRNIEIVEILD